MLLKNVKVILFTLGSLLISSCGQQEPPETNSVRPVRAMKISTASDLAGRSFPGRAKATQEVELSFRIAGPLISLPVNVGDKVKKGNLIARIDPRDFEVQQRKSNGELQRAMANHTRAKGEYQRLLGIQKKDRGLISEVRVERAKEDAQVTKADVLSYQASLEAAKDSVSYTHLKAPFDGAIVATYVENFEYIQARQSIVRLLDSSRVEFKFSVPETMISLVPGLQNISVRFDAFPEIVLPADIKEIGSEASTTTRTYPVTLIMDQPDKVVILPGMSGKVSGNAAAKKAESNATILIPMTAIFSSQSNVNQPNRQSFVWVIDETSNTISKRGVITGELDVAGVIIKEGLQSGDVIAIAGVNYLTEGQQIRPELNPELN